MTLLVAVLLVVAVILALVHAAGPATRVHLGWVAVACVIAAAWMIPALQAT